MQSFGKKIWILKTKFFAYQDKPTNMHIIPNDTLY
jgi:hypothetical protein